MSAAGDRRRAEAVARMADHLLEHGMAAASLRPLAKAAGTSDRMLIYYFGSREALLAATLGRITERLRAALDEAVPPGARLEAKALLGALWEAATAPALAPYMRLWVELAAAASRGGAEREIAGAIIDGFVTWIASHLPGAGGPAQESIAAALLAALDGALLLDAAGRRELAAKAIRLTVLR